MQLLSSKVALPRFRSKSDTSIITLERDASGHAFRDQLTCPLCKQLYLYPFMLPCNHCICEKCIDKRKAQAEVTENFFIIICPVCVKAHCLPYTNKIQLNMNYLRAKLARRYMRRHGFLRWRFDKTRASIYCQLCKEKTKKASKRCLTCRMNFCNECLRLYHSEVSHQDHIFTKAYQEEQGESCCLFHPHSNLSGYCLDDHELICQFCKDTLHNDHETLPLPLACSKEAASLFSAIAKFKKVRYGVDNDLMEMLLLKNNFKSYKETKRKEIRNGFLKLRNIIREQEKEMTEFLENIELKKEKGILEYVTHTSRKISQMDSLIQYSKEALKEENQIAFLQSANVLVNEIEDAIANIYQPSARLREDPIQNLKLNFEELSANMHDLFQTPVRMKQSADKANKAPYPCNSDIMVPRKISSTHTERHTSVFRSPSLSTLNSQYESTMMKKEISRRSSSTPPPHYKERNEMFTFWDASTQISRKERNHQSTQSPEPYHNGSALFPGLVIIYQTLVYPRTAKIYWTCPTEDVDFFDVEFYEVVSISPDNIVQTQLAGELHGIMNQNLELHNLEPNTEYLFKVRAVNVNGPGQWSEICKVVTPNVHEKARGRWGLLRSIQSAFYKQL
ncbi:tripartite motif-containing protein 42 isoform X2 [Pelodiscus sinensis]|uniref:tripartite motif-containing protein 42 isoform X2 n=2 Tax=Pelodiscus sinensis TaxID=13735 RepID=UPI000D71DAE9|nr:tripartite motif-containing protein 42 isoform X2 [Pelodiscus sinensis]|eukprot:XP_025046362.1 tripartite motif-containing protein 42 isoform X2 [Pelodiscus sinensis]